MIEPQSGRDRAIRGGHFGSPPPGRTAKREPDQRQPRRDARPAGAPARSTNAAGVPNHRPSAPNRTPTWIQFDRQDDPRCDTRQIQRSPATVRFRGSSASEESRSHGTPQAQTREKRGRKRRVSGGDGGVQAARRESSARLMPLVNRSIEARENVEKSVEKTGLGADRIFPKWPKGNVVKRSVLICVNTTSCRVLTARRRPRMSLEGRPAIQLTTARRKSFPQRIHRTRRRSLRWRNRLPFSRRCPRVSAKNDLGPAQEPSTILVAE